SCGTEVTASTDTRYRRATHCLADGSIAAQPPIMPKTVTTSSFFNTRGNLLAERFGAERMLSVPSGDCTLAVASGAIVCASAAVTFGAIAAAGVEMAVPGTTAIESVRPISWKPASRNLAQTQSSSRRSVLSLRQLEWQRIRATSKQFG